MKLLNSKITHQQLKKIANNYFGNLVKAVVDVEKEIIVLDAEMHADEESFLLKHGSKQTNLWGINLYPAVISKDWIEFDSMINLRPNQKNFTRGVDDPDLRKKIIAIVNKWIK